MAISDEDYARLTRRDADGNLPTFGVKGYRYDVESFAGIIDDSPGVRLPDRAAWARSFRSAPNAKRDKAAYEAWRSGDAI